MSHEGEAQKGSQRMRSLSLDLTVEEGEKCARLKEQFVYEPRTEST